MHLRKAQPYPAAAIVEGRAAIGSLSKTPVPFPQAAVNEAETLGETLAGFRRESFEMVTGECPDVADLGKMPLNFKRPAVKRGFAFPEQFFVTMEVAAINIVFRCVIAE